MKIALAGRQPKPGLDYKTGRLDRTMAEVIVKGGSELQRCLYAFAVKTLLGPKVKVDAARRKAFCGT
jgi:hypothetical protein